MDSFSFSQLAKANREPAAPLPAKPSQGTDPATGGVQQPAGSSSDGFNSSSLAHLALCLCTAWLTRPCVPWLGSLSPKYVGQDSDLLGETPTLLGDPKYCETNRGQMADSNPTPMERCRTGVQLNLGLWDPPAFVTWGFRLCHDLHPRWSGMLMPLPTLASPALHTGLSCRGALRQNHDSGGNLASLPQMLDLARPWHSPFHSQHKAGAGRTGLWWRWRWYRGGRQGGGPDAGCGRTR